VRVRRCNHVKRREGGGGSGVVPAVRAPADNLELRAAAFHRIDAVVGVVVVRLRRSLLSGVVSEVFPLGGGLCLPFPTALIPVDILGVAAQVEFESKV